MANWWEQDQVIAPTQMAAPVATSGVIYGRPKTIDPAEQRRLQLSINSDARAAEASRRADAADARAAARETRQQELDAAKLNQTAQLTEAQAKSTNFFTSALGAEREWQALESNPATKQATLPHGLLGDAARAVLPEGVVNSNTSPERQRAEQAQRNFIRASLRLESGAAIGNQEYDRQYQAFFPQTGDSPDVLAQKARSRAELIEGFRIGAGRGAEQVPADLRKFYDDFRGQKATAPREDRGVLTFNDQLSAKAAQSFRLTSEQDSAVRALIRNGGTDAQINALMSEFHPGSSLGADNLAALRAFATDPRTKDLPFGETDYSKVDEIKPVDPGDGAVGAAVRGVANASSLGFVNRLGAIADTVQGEGSYAENLDRRRGYDAYDEQNNAGSRLAGELAGGFALPIRGPQTAGNLALHGAGYGAAYGLGNSYGSAADRLAAAGTGAALGGTLGYLGGRAGQYLAGHNPPPGGGGNPIIDAAQRQGVDITVADAYPSARSAVGFLESVPGSGGAIRNPLVRSNEQIEQRVADIGGAAVPRQTAGESVVTGGQRYVDRSRDVVNRLYDRAAQLAGNARVTPTSALQTIDQHVAQLSETPSTNATKLNVLGQIRADLVDQAGNIRPLSIQALRDIRTNARDELAAQGLRYTDTERRVMSAIDGVSTDIRSQLAGGALRAYDRADRSYRERANIVDNVIEKFIGADRLNPNSGEKVMASIENAAQPRAGNARALDQLVARLEPAEREQVAGTIASQLGRRSADGEAEFSAQRFFSDVQKYSPEARAAIWGRQGAADLADLAALAEQRGGVMGRLNNSRSGQVSNWGHTLRGLLAGGAGAGAVYAPGTTIAGLTAANLTARALGNRRVVAALASAGRAQTPTAQAAVVRQLGVIASRSPSIANDILPIQRALQSAIPRAAAEDQEQQRR